MSVRKADDFIAEVERQFDWYLTKAGWEVADRYLDAVDPFPICDLRVGFVLGCQCRHARGRSVGVFD